MARCLIITVALMLALPSLGRAQCGGPGQACCTGNVCNGSDLFCAAGTCERQVKRHVDFYFGTARVFIDVASFVRRAPRGSTGSCIGVIHYRLLGLI